MSIKWWSSYLGNWMLGTVCFSSPRISDCRTFSATRARYWTLGRPSRWSVTWQRRCATYTASACGTATWNRRIASSPTAGSCASPPSDSAAGCDPNPSCGQVYFLALVLFDAKKNRWPVSLLVSVRGVEHSNISWLAGNPPEFQAKGPPKKMYIK